MPAIISTDKKTKKREKNDFYPTKQEFANAHIKQLVKSWYIPYPKVLDVGVGTAVYGYAWDKLSKPTDKLIGIDVNLDKLPIFHPYNFVYDGDFLSFGFSEKYDYIIGNPPYFEVQKFVERGIDLLARDGILSFLLKASYLETITRFDFFKIHKPTSVWQSVTRPVGNHAESYIVVNFTKTPSPTTELNWILGNKKGFDFI